MKSKQKRMEILSSIKKEALYDEKAQGTNISKQLQHIEDPLEFAYALYDRIVDEVADEK